MKHAAISLTTLAVFAFSSGHVNAVDSCRSFSTTIEEYETICFSKTKYSYRCIIRNGKPEINFVTKLSFKPELRKDGGVCDHIDTSNLKPNGTPYGTKINRDHN
jgi:hypothetical protein